jgi:PAS domain S-box-containing protein
LKFSVSNFWDHLPFIGRMLFTASVALLIAGGVMLYSSTEQDAYEAARDLQDEMSAELKILPAFLSELVVAGDYATLQQTLNESVKRGGVERILYRDAAGTTIESLNKREGCSAPGWFVRWLGLSRTSRQTPVTVGGRRYGSIEITLTPARKIDAAWTGLVQHMLVLLLAITLDFIGIWIVLRSGMRPLRALDTGSAAVGGGDFSVRIPPQGSPEFRRAIASFNHMAAYLERLMEEVRLSQASLRESERRFRALVEQAPEAILIFDPKLNRFVDANRNAEKLFGRPREALLKETPESFQTAPSADGRQPAEAFGDHIERALSGETVAIEQLVRDPGGKQFYCDVRFASLPSTNRKLVRVSYIDINRRKQAEEETRRLNRELEQRVEARTAALEQANKELEWFSYSVSHDLRAPLRAIGAYTRILEEEHAAQLNQDAAHCLHKVAEGAARMGRLIDDLLAFSRAARHEIATENVDVAALVREAFDELSIGESDRKLTLSLHEAPPARCDPALIRQVVTNLMSNAIKFTGGHEESLVEFGGRRLEAQNEYYLKDNGAGFDMQFAHKLFAAFERLHSRQEFEGTGVGLAIVKRIVERHGGRVWAEAKVGQGAVFYFSLPAATAADCSPALDRAVA